MVVNRARRAGVAVAGSVLLVLGLASCSLLEGPTPATPDRPQIETPAEPAVFVPGGSAQENLPFFQELLLGYASGEQPIQGQPIVEAVAAGGFDKADMQVSFDQSKTNLEADSIFVAVRSGETCLIGQLIPETREVAAQAVDAVGPERNVCLIGQTRPIDW